MDNAEQNLHPYVYFADCDWKEHPVYPLSDWRYEVANDYTRLGYADWCLNRWESESH